MSRSEVFSADFKTTPYWWDAIGPPALSMKPVPQRCDAVIVGAGYAGLSAALFAKLHAAARDSLTALPPDAGLGAAPHSLRAVGADALAAFADRFPNGPLHLHLAEQEAEVEEVRRGRADLA